MQLKFVERNLTYVVPTKPNQVTPFSFALKHDRFCLKQIKWTYSIPTITDNYGWPRVPLRVSIESICQDEVGNPIVLTIPQVVDQFVGSVRNESTIPVNLTLSFDGIFVSGPGLAELDAHYLANFCMLEPAQKALLQIKQFHALEANSNSPLMLEEKTSRQLTMKHEDRSSILIGDLVQLISDNEIEIKISDLKKIADGLINRGWTR